MSDNLKYLASECQELQDENKQLKQYIEKLKCCGNCKYCDSCMLCEHLDIDVKKYEICNDWRYDKNCYTGRRLD